MAKLFQVNLPDGMSNVKLDSQGRATVQYTAKNVSARTIDGRAVLISLPQVKPPSGPVEKGWVTIDGKPDRHFDVNKEETFTVKIAVPPKSAPGDYTFRLDTVWVDQTDQGDPGGAVRFTVPVTTVKPFPMWVIPVVLLVIIGIGVGVWLAMSGGHKVPDLRGQNVTDAAAKLQEAGFTLDSAPPATVDGKPEDSGKIVDQVPPAGAKASKGQAVKVSVGTQMVAVPQLVGIPFAQVQGALSEKGLTMGTSTTSPNSNVNGGVVFAQNPGANEIRKAGTPVDVQVAAQMVIVPNVSGQVLGAAIQTLRGLTVTTLNGDSTKTVVSQSPGPGASVPIGSAVTLNFPPGACVGFTCALRGQVVQQMVMEQVRIRNLQPAPPK